MASKVFQELTQQLVDGANNHATKTNRDSKVTMDYSDDRYLSLKYYFKNKLIATYELDEHAQLGSENQGVISYKQQSNKRRAEQQNITNVRVGLKNLGYPLGEVITVKEFEDGGNVTNGFHTMPDGTVMSDSAHMEDGGEVTFTDYKDEQIMYEPHYKEYYVGDTVFKTLKEAKAFIDKGSPMDSKTKDAYRHGAFEDGGKILGDYNESAQIVSSKNFDNIGGEYAVYIHKGDKVVDNKHFFYTYADAKEWGTNYLQNNMDTYREYKNGGGVDIPTDIDLFENYELIPSNVQSILDEYELEDSDYPILDELQTKLEGVGFTFDYGLDAEPYNLRRVGTRGSEDYYKEGGKTTEFKVGDWVTKKEKGASVNRYKVWEVDSVGGRIKLEDIWGNKDNMERIASNWKKTTAPRTQMSNGGGIPKVGDIVYPEYTSGKHKVVEVLDKKTNKGKMFMGGDYYEVRLEDSNGKRHISKSNRFSDGGEVRFMDSDTPYAHVSYKDVKTGIQKTQTFKMESKEESLNKAELFAQNLPNGTNMTIWMPSGMLMKKGGSAMAGRRTVCGDDKAILEYNEVSDHYSVRDKEKGTFMKKGGTTRREKRKSSKDGKWIQNANKEMEEKGTIGAFTKQAKTHGKTPVEFAKMVLKNPKKYSLRTERRAQFVKNTNPELFAEGGGAKGYDYTTLKIFGDDKRGYQIYTKERGVNGREHLGRDVYPTKERAEEIIDRMLERNPKAFNLGRKHYLGFYAEGGYLGNVGGTSVSEVVVGKPIVLKQGGSTYAEGGEVGEYYLDTRYDKPFRIIFIDGDKMGIEYIDKKNQTTDSKTIDKSEFDYYVKMGAWNKYTQPFTYQGGGGIEYVDREDFYEKNPNFPRRIEITKEQYINNKDFISQQKWGRNIVDTNGYEDNNGVEFVEFDIEVGEKSSWDMYSWINENIPQEDIKIFVHDKSFLTYQGGGEISQGARMALNEAERMEKQGRLINTNEVDEYDEDNSETVYSLISLYSDQFPEDEEEIESVLMEKYPKHFSKGGSTYQGGGEIEEQLSVVEFYDKEGQFLGYTIKDTLNPKGRYTLFNKKERAEQIRQFLIDNPSRLAYYRKNEYSQGGSTYQGGGEIGIGDTVKYKGEHATYRATVKNIYMDEPLPYAKIKWHNIDKEEMAYLTDLVKLDSSTYARGGKTDRMKFFRDDKNSDSKRMAKPKGYRFKGDKPMDYKKPTPLQIHKGLRTGKVYYEARPERSDINNNAKMMLGEGGKIKDKEGQYSWFFNWNEGGFNEVWAKTKSEAIKKAKEMGYPTYMPDNPYAQKRSLKDVQEMYGKKAVDYVMNKVHTKGNWSNKEQKTLYPKLTLESVGFSDGLTPNESTFKKQSAEDSMRTTRMGNMMSMSDGGSADDPKIVRSFFEEEEFEYADGGGLSADELKAKKERKAQDRKDRIEWIKKQFERDVNNPKRKWIDLYYVQGNYGQGWEDLTAHDNYLEAQDELRVYNENENYPHRRISRKVSVSDYKKGNYAKGGSTDNDPKIVRSFFEEEEFEYADGGGIGREHNEHNLEMTIKTAFMKELGVSKTLDAWNRDWVVTPYFLMRSALIKNWIKPSDINADMLNEAIYEAESIDDSYRDSGHGIGSSDMNSFVANFLRNSGIKIEVVNGRYIRVDDNGNEVVVENKFARGGKTDRMKFFRDDKNSDSKRMAKPKGYRFKGDKPMDYKKPTPLQIHKGLRTGKVYYEARPERSDINNNAKMMLAGGGRIGDEIGVYELTQALGHEPNFPYQEYKGYVLTKCMFRPYYKIVHRKS